MTQLDRVKPVIELVPAHGLEAPRTVRTLMSLAGLGCADLLLVVGAVALQINPYAMLAMHVVLLFLVMRLGGALGATDGSAWYPGLLLVLIGGPVGCLGVLWLAVSTLRGSHAKDTLESWYLSLAGEAQPDATVELHEARLAGRAFQPDRSLPRRFRDVIEHGSLPEKQQLLGHIGLKYHADYFPLLAIALRSPQAAVRVQSAAVFVKLKDEFRRQLQEARSRGRAAEGRGDPAELLAAARSVVACAACGFLDKTDSREAWSEAKSFAKAAMVHGGAGIAVEAEPLLCGIVAASGGDDEIVDHLLSRAPPLASALGQQLARCLVAAGRHGDLHRLLAGSLKPSGGARC